MSAHIEDCPFCGSANVAIGYSGQLATSWHMRCVDCGACGPTVSSAAATGAIADKELLPAWNRRAALASHQGVAVPAGWALVPVKLADEMVIAFAEKWYAKRQAIDDPDMDDAYAALLAAAPQPPAVKEAEPLGAAPKRTTSDAAYESLSPEHRKKFEADMLLLEQRVQDHRRSRERRQHVVPVEVERRLADARGSGVHQDRKE